jgi:hypothetical protein
MNTTTRHEAEVDTAISAASTVLNKAKSALVWAETERVPKESAIEAATAALAEAKAEYDRLCGQYTGWSRFFLVTNVNGHIHSGTNCSTCRWDTSFAWLPELSGLTEADAVEEYGEILCSICFPSAPVEWTNGVNKKTAAQKRLHKALLDIERSPEGRKVKKYTDDLRSIERGIQYGTSQVEWAARRLDEEGHDDHLSERLVEAKAKLAKVEAKLPKVQAKLEAAQAALDAALSA